MSQQLIQIISAGGLLAIFLTMAAESAGIPISSEIVVPLGGALASQGKLSFVGVVIAASAGNLMGSLVAYLIVRRYGEILILGPGRRVGLTAGHLRLANRFFERWGLAAVFTGRLLPVIRTYISFPAGLSRITVVPFMLATILGDHTGSRLYWDLIDPGFADGVEVSYQDYNGAGAFYTFLSCEPEEAQANLGRVADAYRDVMAEGVADDELERAKNKVMARSVLRMARRLRTRLRKKT